MFLLYIPWHFPLHKDLNITGASEIAEEKFKYEYPAVYNHLLKHKTGLSNRNKSETGIRYEWYALQRWGSNYWEDFSKQKIVWKRIGSILRFSFDEEGFISLDSTCFAVGKSVKYLTAFFNSKVGNYILKDSPKTGTGDLLISVQAFDNITIPKIDNILEKKIDTWIDEIIRLDNKKEIMRIEKQLDEIFCNLYDFNVQELTEIEKNSIT